MLAIIEANSSLRKKVLLLFFIILIPLVILEIWSVNRLSTYGNRISALDNIKAQLSLENEILENQIAQKASLSHISTESTGLGFVKTNSTIYLQPPNLALNQ